MKWMEAVLELGRSEGDRAARQVSSRDRWIALPQARTASRVQLSLQLEFANLGGEPIQL